MRCSSLCMVSVLLLAFAMVTASDAEIPQVISCQGKVTDLSGTPVGDGDYSMTFTIYDAASGGTSLWSSGSVTVTVVPAPSDVSSATRPP